MKLTKALEIIKSILNKQPDIEKDIFEVVLDEIKKLVTYDQALIILLEGDSLIVRKKENIKSLDIKNYRKLLTRKDKILTKVVLNRVSILENTLREIQKELNIDFEGEYRSVLVIPLVIREMVYGMVILTGDIFTHDDVKALESVICAASYLIKDAELSSVFKMQLNILKENIKQRSNSLELIKEQNKKILEADKIKNEFLANISHELRTPLNAIIGFSEALDMSIFGTLNEKQAEYVRDIHSSGIHLLQMINDLLDLSKIESGKMELNKEIFEVKKAIDEVMSIIKPLADKKSLNFTIDLGSKNLMINADRRKFQQIFYNLLSNAIKFSENNGRISLSSSLKNDAIRFSIKDNGIGIAPQFHKKIFEKFQQVFNNSSIERSGSTGLGLTITRELIEMHGGKISVESEEGKGANFIFTLPVSHGKG